MCISREIFFSNVNTIMYNVLLYANCGGRGSIIRFLMTMEHMKLMTFYDIRAHGEKNSMFYHPLGNIFCLFALINFVISQIGGSCSKKIQIKIVDFLSLS